MSADYRLKVGGTLFQTLWRSGSLYAVESCTVVFLGRHFLLPRDASAERGDATVSRLSVCPSVRP